MVEPSVVGTASWTPERVSQALRLYLLESHAASVIAENYRECRADEERLSALQDWVRKEAAFQP